MIKIAQSLFIIVTTSESVLGICCNGYIWLVNSISLVKSKKMSLSEFVITSLAICRICFLSIIITNVLIVFESNLSKTSIGSIIEFWFWILANFLSINLATCLSILYCLKIANFSHHVFLWLKWRVSQVVRWILLVSVLLSFFSTLMLIKEFHDAFSDTEMAPTVNCTEDIRKKKCANVFMYIFITLCMVMPFILSLISYVLILLSLRRHTQQMQNNGTGSRDPSTEAHVRATKIILSFLFLFIVYLAGFFLITWGIFFPDSILAWVTGEMILAVEPTVHSIIIIWGNNKLKQAFLGMLQIKK